MSRTSQGSVATALLLLCAAGALVAGIHAGPPQEPRASVQPVNPAQQRLDMIKLLKSIDGRLEKDAELPAAQGREMISLLRQIHGELSTMDERLKQIEIELSRANEGG
jgi:hypothetical protein